MPVLNIYFPESLYPEDYTPPIAGFDYNPFFTELVDFAGEQIVGTPLPTLIKFQLANGLKGKIVGTGLKLNSDGAPVSGTINELHLLQNDGKTLVQKMTGLSVKAIDYSRAIEAGGTPGLAEFLLKGSDTLNGSAGNDDLFGYAGNDTIKSGRGDDFLEGARGTDTYDGGAGYDTLFFSTKAGTKGVTLDAQFGKATDEFGNKETFTGIEEFRGSKFADTMKGSSKAETFVGLKGADTFDGRGGSDTVSYIKDGQFGGTAGITANLTTGVATDGFGSKDTLISIENVIGSRLADKLTGNSGSNLFDGKAGDDVITAGGGNDFLLGGNGNDTLTGGTGGDTFVFNINPNGILYVDTITDFKVPDDTIELHKNVFPTITGSGTLTSSQFVANSTGKAKDLNDHIIYETDTGKLFYDSNGSASGGSVHFATLAKGLLLTNADFFVV